MDYKEEIIKIFEDAGYKVVDGSTYANKLIRRDGSTWNYFYIVFSGTNVLINKRVFHAANDTNGGWKRLFNGNIKSACNELRSEGIPWHNIQYVRL